MKEESAKEESVKTEKKEEKQEKEAVKGETETTEMTDSTPAKDAPTDSKVCDRIFSSLLFSLLYS